MRDPTWPKPQDYAEWIIARLTDRGRAASIVGDLLETGAERGDMWFWISLAEVVLSLIWRGALGFLAAFFMGLFWSRIFAAAVFGIHALHRPPGPWMSPLLTVRALDMLAWGVAAYAAIRYGLRDSFTQLALGLSSLITMAILCWWTPIVAVACMALTASIVIASMWSAHWRGALTILVVAVVVGFEGLRFWMYLDLILLDVVYSYPLMVYVAYGFALLAVGSMTTTCSLLHRRLLERNPQDAEIDSSI